MEDVGQRRGTFSRMQCVIYKNLGRWHIRRVEFVLHWRCLDMFALFRDVFYLRERGFSSLWFVIYPVLDCRKFSSVH